MKRLVHLLRVLRDGRLMVVCGCRATSLASISTTLDRYAVTCRKCLFSLSAHDKTIQEPLDSMEFRP